MTMTIEEAEAMVGTEFTYVFEDGDTILAYVKAFDPEEKGLTCYTLEPMTRNGWKPSPSKIDMPDGTFCVIGGSVELFGLKCMLSKLEEIKNTGKWKTPLGFFNFAGCAF